MLAKENAEVTFRGLRRRGHMFVGMVGDFVGWLIANFGTSGLLAGVLLVASRCRIG